MIQARDLTKTYGSGPAAVAALKGVSFDVGARELVVLLGPSGSGKTTTLNLLGAIETPDGGRLTVDGIEVADLAGRAQTTFRREHVGFVFQFFNLVPTLTALENVALIAELTGPDPETRARDALDDVGLGDRVDHFPGQLSGGEQQRVALARALVKKPPVLLADEPTGALDVETGRGVLALLQRATRERECAVILVTHNAVIARMADRVLRLRDGEIVSDHRVDSPAAATDIDW